MSYSDITDIVNAFSDVLIVKVFIDTLDDRLRNLYSNQVNNHNYKILTECSKPAWDRHINSGFDLYTPCSQSFTPDTVNVIDFNLICAAVFYSKSPAGMIARNSGFYMYPRSSLANTDLRLANSVGIIDSGYRGSLKGMFDYVGDRMVVNRQVGQYERIVQICSPTLGPVYIELVDSLNQIGTTERGEGGFGSTGIV